VFLNNSSNHLDISKRKMTMCKRPSVIPYKKVVRREGNRQAKLMMISECETCIIKLWDNESYDVDEDGTKYHLKCENYDDFVKTQLEEDFKILHIR